ncbi:MAG: hypothetical protein ACOC2C_01955 [Cyclonatronaceae bacterium]
MPIPREESFSYYILSLAAFGLMTGDSSRSFCSPFYEVGIYESSKRLFTVGSVVQNDAALEGKRNKPNVTLEVFTPICRFGQL